MQPIPQEGTGSGFVYGTEGHIVTNYHVVADAESVSVALNGEPMAHLQGLIVTLETEMQVEDTVEITLIHHCCTTVAVQAVQAERPGGKGVRDAGRSARVVLMEYTDVMITKYQPTERKY